MTVKRVLYDIKNMMLSCFYLCFFHRYFMFDGIRFKYFVNWYNRTWMNCRAIEIPVFNHLFTVYGDKRVLEVGNVMNHYNLRCDHHVLDKYEVSDGVINEDIVDYKPSQRYDVVLSCSTLEHVGFDEEVKDEKKFITAVTNIIENVLVPGGVLYFSVPIGYNPGLDRILDYYHVRFDNIWCYRRLDGNSWVPCRYDEIQGCSVGDGLVIGKIIV